MHARNRAWPELGLAPEQVLLGLRGDAIAAAQAHRDLLTAARREDAAAAEKQLQEALASAQQHVRTYFHNRSLNDDCLCVNLETIRRKLLYPAELEGSAKVYVVNSPVLS